MSDKIAFIGFGEAASTFANDADWRGCAVGHDIDPRRSAAMAAYKVEQAADVKAALGDAQIILSLVTADKALDAALEYADHLKPGTLWIDMNSVSPGTKRKASAAIMRSGADYVDAALLSPVRPAGLSLPVKLSGTKAEAAHIALNRMGFRNVSVVGEEIGRASSIKMIRSIMVKGIEALTAEMVEAGDAAGVTRDVLASLDASTSKRGWAEQSAYNLERMATHGARRAAEMEEVAATLIDLGIDPTMTRAAALRQGEAAAKTIAKRDAA